MHQQEHFSYEEARDGNRELWDELTPVHIHSYGVDRFLAGERWLPLRILEEVGDVKGRSLLHLQCHFGLDTLAWARQGAEVTGVDFSPEAIKAAQELAIKTKLPARFLCSDIYDLPQTLDETYDIIFTSIGVLCWLVDLDAWARIIAEHLKPGGTFYIMEGHPLITTFDERGSATFLISYFHKHSPYIWDEEDPDYMDGSYFPKNPSFEWQWAISDIINAVLSAGLKLDFFHEFDALEDPVFPEMVKQENGLYTYPDMPVPLPIVFSLKAHKDK